jgi:hypothetical protein
MSCKGVECQGRAVNLRVHDRVNGTHEWEGSGVFTIQSKMFTDWMITGKMPKIVFTGIEKIEEREDFSIFAFGHRLYQEFPSNNLLHPHSTLHSVLVYIFRKHERNHKIRTVYLFYCYHLFLCKNS